MKEMNRSTILILAFLTLLVMGGGGLMLIHYLGESPVQLIIAGKFPFYIQVLTGSLYGIAASLLAWKVVEWPRMKDTRTFFEDLFRNSGIKGVDIIAISVCAGIGEEVLFRGFVQPYLGIWVTSILFVLLHGYLNPLNRPLFTYGVVMVVLIGGIGLIAQRVGLLASMVAHTVIDIYLLRKLTSS
jgi:membrane protease YdiL (CAAX protease family)